VLEAADTLAVVPERIDHRVVTFPHQGRRYRAGLLSGRSLPSPLRGFAAGSGLGQAGSPTAPGHVGAPMCPTIPGLSLIAGWPRVVGAGAPRGVGAGAPPTAGPGVRSPRTRGTGRPRPAQPAGCG